MLAVPVVSHRLLLDAEARFSGTTVIQVIEQILGDVPPPVQGSGQALGAAAAAGMPAAAGAAAAAGRSKRPDPEELLLPQEGEDEAAERTLHRTPHSAGLDPSRPGPRPRVRPKAADRSP